MKLQAFSVYDRVGEGFGRPMFGQSIGAVVRSFRDEVNRSAEDNPYFKHPDDYELVHIGEFDDETGHFTPIQQRVVMRGRDCKETN